MTVMYNDQILLVNQHLLTNTDAMILTSTCMIIGAIATLIGFKVAPKVKRYLALLKLKLFMMQLKMIK